ncbi:hypothetical protein [Legionella tunisiensis]|uniref:hypothetical protein n=1 Tax=Legionella tunisiensis TaxID=1034944 RepID=UPI0006843244|nr:hypothetical protein [Legionella tunisiensis]
MGDFKSKLPDFKELSSIAGKLFKDVKTSVSEIIDDYKKNAKQKNKLLPHRLNLRLKHLLKLKLLSNLRFNQKPHR